MKCSLILQYSHYLGLDNFFQPSDPPCKQAAVGGGDDYVQVGGEAHDDVPAAPGKHPLPPDPSSRLIWNIFW